MIYTKVPQGFNPTFEAAGCFLERGRNFLLLLRQNDCPQGNTWGLPSGKIEKGESALEGVIREIHEETGIVVPARRMHFISKVYVIYPDYDFSYYIFRSKMERLPQIKIDPKEHKDFRWVSPREAFSLPIMLDLDWCINLVYKK
jgi:8-oxo-dGTP diphosphatase